MCRARDVKDCVLDGEMVIWDSEYESVLCKSQNMAMKSVGTDPADRVSRVLVGYGGGAVVLLCCGVVVRVVLAV